MRREPQTPAEWRQRAVWARAKAERASERARATGEESPMLSREFQRDVATFTRIAEQADAVARALEGGAE